MRCELRLLKYRRSWQKISKVDGFGVSIISVVCIMKYLILLVSSPLQLRNQITQATVYHYSIKVPV